MAESAINVDSECIKCFQMFVAKEHANSSTLSEAEKKFGKTTTVRKILKDCLGESNEMIRLCESTIYPKYQEKKTKKISDETFIEKVLPDLAALKTKKGDNPDIILKKWKTKMVENVGKEETKTKNADVVNRLTDTSKYTGSHKERFDEEGKGRGAAGTEDRVENKGYVSGYKGQGTYGQKK